ncbi:MAG: hypothetical protein IKJ24_04915 [Clostridia bacterium]|nr:hypothetical protein [Clostridia bacterium]
MKIVKILSFVLVLSMITCVFFSCDAGGAGDADVAIPERDLYKVTVSFQIKDSTGKTVIEAIDYTYKGHAEPTILNVLDTYLAVEEDWVCKIDKNNTITQIGGMKANKNNGDYWGYVSNVKGELTDELKSKRNGDEEKNVSPEALTVEEINSCFTIKDMQAIGLGLEQIKKNQSEGALKDAFLIDGAEFTVILFVSED